MQEQATDRAGAAVVLDDLAEPRFGREAQELLGSVESIAELCPLDAGALHAQASAELGLDDFGPRDYLERMDLLLECYRSLPGLSPAGQVNLYLQFLQLLKNRLLLADLLRREPTVLETELVPPVIIAGLPRTGTTHLQQLLAATGLFRTLPYWESLEPFPLPTERGAEPDPRIARTAVAMDAMHTALPHFILMHEMDGPEHVHEEIALLANDFSTMYFETLTDVPGWVDHYLSHNQAPHYAYLRVQLQALQHMEGSSLRGGRRWLLKSPQHLEQLPVVAEVFPEATVVITHRDPAHVVTSLATMVAYTERMFRAAPLDPPATGRRWADRLGVMLDALLRDRDVLGPDTSMDLPFDTFMADQEGALERVLALAGERFTPSARAGAVEYLASHARGHLGRIDYRPEGVGLDPDELAERFAPYSERFLAGAG
ncbi:sulfotransferase family protein [Nocardioides bizhenqiangii]|uniref:Sulfotransferase n=1 Tax=Nocardioides bizhenqiangii TaxID=3095076 RepID=A0ABZ0ZQG6_9ACTN|nr:sulfotransferase [Nocardioides sp. HM61]WQQ25718.1 sulfotransferase [Nocardioides sp. HM61]